MLRRWLARRRQRREDLELCRRYRRLYQWTIDPGGDPGGWCELRVERFAAFLRREGYDQMTPEEALSRKDAEERRWMEWVLEARARRIAEGVAEPGPADLEVVDSVTTYGACEEPVV